MNAIRSLNDLDPVDARRIATACRHEAFRLRQRLAQGRVPGRHVPATEDRIVSLVMGDQVLTQHAEKYEPPPPFVSIGEASRRVLLKIHSTTAAHLGRQSKEVVGHG